MIDSINSLTMIELLHDDCMNVMARYPDKYFELAIVDPPYGIGAENGYGQSNNNKIHAKEKEWDKLPNENYFKELFRVSKEQIIWGGNYFSLPPTKGFIVWDKQQQGRNFADCEYAWTSFNGVAKIVKVRYLEPYECNIYNTVKRIHPTQKPVKLYRWLLHNYAKHGDKILDTHLGSGSIAIACHDMGFSLVGVEIDEDYYKAACKRFKEQTAQLKLAV